MKTKMYSYKSMMTAAYDDIVAREKEYQEYKKTYSFDGLRGSSYTDEEKAEIRKYLPGGENYDETEWF